MSILPVRREKAKPGPLHHPGPAIDGPESLARALAGLLVRDPGPVAAMLALGGPPPLRLQAPGFAGLAGIVVSQQVSVASASAMYARLAQRFQPLEARALHEASDADFRSCGLSGAKIRTLRALSAAVVHGGLDLAALGALTAGEAHRALTAVKGIGPWTAELFLLSCHGHADAWPAGDIALQEAARIVLKLANRPDAREMEAIGERWRPWRAVAARLLWSTYKVCKGRAGLAEPLERAAPGISLPGGACHRCRDLG